MEKKPGENPFDEPMRVLSEADPERVALLSGALWEPSGVGGRLRVRVLDGAVAVLFPDMVVEAEPHVSSFVLKLLTVIYLGSTDGTAPEGSWMAYRDLPGGRFYEPVVKRSVEDPVALAFGENLDAFSRAAAAMGGSLERVGDRSYSFALFPNVLLCIAVWRSDEEFDAGARVLFDAACPHHLNPFELRMGAEAVASRLLKSGE